MRTPAALKGLDDRVLGRRRPAVTSEEGEPVGRTDEDAPVDRAAARRSPATGKGAREALGIVLRVSRFVLFALAAVLLVGILFVLAPTNADNGLVQLVVDVSDAVAGPFRDVFAVSDNADRETVVNYGFAAALYALVAFVLGKLSPSST